MASGQTAQQVLTLTNTSTGVNAGTVTVHRLTSQFPFVSASTCGAALVPGQSCTVTVTYTPLNQVASGAPTPPSNTDAGTLVIESDATSSPDTVNLTGSSSPASVTSPSNTAPVTSFALSQNSLTFPATAVGYTSAAQSVTLSNTGTAVLHILGVTASTDFAVANTCATLLPGATCTLTATFAPQLSTQSSATRIGTIAIASDASNSLEFLSFAGSANPSTLSFQPAALNFGVQVVGTTATLPVQITNTGSSAAAFTGITASGDYAATGNCAGGSLAPNASCTVQVAFTPTAAGARPGSLTVASSASGVPLTVALSGTGAQSYFHLSTANLSFGSVAVGATSSLSLTLSNSGSGVITGLALAATGDYTLSSPCGVTSLAGGASCSVTVTFAPTAIGTRSGTLSVASSDPGSPATVLLSGSGTTATAPSTGTFTLTVDGASAASQTVSQSHPASYMVAVTPQNGFTGTVVLNCTGISAAPAATCSMSPSSVTLNGASQSVTVTINTVTSASAHLPPSTDAANGIALCLIGPAGFLFWRFRRTLRRSPLPFLAALLGTAMMFFTSGCGSSGNPNLLIAPSGTYQYTVTATGNSAPPQTVTLNLVIQ